MPRFLQDPINRAHSDFLKQNSELLSAKIDQPSNLLMYSDKDQNIKCSIIAFDVVIYDNYIPSATRYAYNSTPSSLIVHIIFSPNTEFYQIVDKLYKSGRNENIVIELLSTTAQQSGKNEQVLEFMLSKISGLLIDEFSTIQPMSILTFFVEGYKVKRIIDGKENKIIAFSKDIEAKKTQESPVEVKI